MATRLPLWHRISVLLAVVVVSASILVWGYVLNVGRLVVEARSDDVVLVDGAPLPPDGRVRAGRRYVRVDRPHHEPFTVTVQVVREETTTVTPLLTFLPYRSEEVRSIARPFTSVALHAATYREVPGGLDGYPAKVLDVPELPTGITDVRASQDWALLWVATRTGEESLRSSRTGEVLWEGTTYGRAFSGGRFVAVRGRGDDVTLDLRAEDGTWTTLGALDGGGTFTVVPSPDGTRVAVVSDERGTILIVGDAGRERVALQEAALDARWSPDGTKLLIQVRLAGAGAAVRLVLYDVASGEEQLLDVRAPLALTAFSSDGRSLVAFERQATSETDQEEVLRQLSDARALQLADDLEEERVSFTDFQDLLPPDVAVPLALVRIDLATYARSIVLVSGGAYSSDVLRLEEGPTPGELLVLLPTSVETVVLEEPVLEDVAAPPSRP